MRIIKTLVTLALAAAIAERLTVPQPCGISPERERDIIESSRRWRANFA